MRMLQNSCWSLMIALVSVMYAHAITSPRESIETISFNYANYRTHESIGGGIDAQVPVYLAQYQSFFAARIAGAHLRQKQGPSYDNLSLELGLKKNLTSVTSITVAGSYDWFFGSDPFTSAAAHIRLRQAFQPNHAPLVPFVRLNGGLHFIEPVTASPARQNKEYRLLVLEALGGIEIRIRKDLRWIFEGGRSQSRAINNAGPELADGWIGRIAMQYDWF